MTKGELRKLRQTGVLQDWTNVPKSQIITIKKQKRTRNYNIATK